MSVFIVLLSRLFVGNPTYPYVYSYMAKEEPFTQYHLSVDAFFIVSFILKAIVMCAITTLYCFQRRISRTNKTLIRVRMCLVVRFKLFSNRSH